jgi:formylglycine-generating enzyme required for sulfatase activity
VSAPSPATLLLVLTAMLAVTAQPARGDVRGQAPSREAPSRPEKRAKADAGLVTLRAPATDRVFVRGGAFVMGSEALDIVFAFGLCQSEPLGEECRAEGFENELVPHRVSVSSFLMDRREVTVARFRRCVEAGPCKAPPLAAGGKRFEVPDFPVTNVTWSDADTYCKWAGGRLPTEAEWERAARGTRGRRFPWGDVYNPFLLNGGRFSVQPFDERDGFAELAPVGSFPGGRTPEGIDDLAGNVEEWVGDYYAPSYPEGAEHDPKGPDTGDEKVLRGGSFKHGRAWQRGASRGHDLPASRHHWRGFRCVYAVDVSRDAP